MATWFAQTSGANINAANMWNSLPAGGGTVLTWPPAANDVLIANGKEVRVNVNTTVAEARNGTTGGATSGGYFRFLTAGVSFTAKFYNDSAAATYIWIMQATSGTVYIVGNTYAGAGANQYGGYISAGATTQITGDIYAGTGSAAYGLLTATGAGVIGHTGNVYGGSGSGAAGVRNAIAANYTLTGNAIAGSGGEGIQNISGGTTAVSGYVQASASMSGALNFAQGAFEVGETRSASNGRGAVTGAFRYASATAAKHMPYTPDGQISMTVLDVAAIVPAESDVRKTVVYGDGAYTGTLPLGRSRTSMAGRF